jgi:hypothetical protein
MRTAVVTAMESTISDPAWPFRAEIGPFLTTLKDPD